MKRCLWWTIRSHSPCWEVSLEIRTVLSYFLYRESDHRNKVSYTQIKMPSSCILNSNVKISRPYWQWYAVVLLLIWLIYWLITHIHRVSIMCRRYFKNNYKSDIKSNFKDISIFLFLCVEGASGNEIGDEGCFAGGHITPFQSAQHLSWLSQKGPWQGDTWLKLKGKEPPGEDLCREGEEKVWSYDGIRLVSGGLGGQGVQGSGAGGKAYGRDFREGMEEGTLPLLLPAPPSSLQQG